MTHLNLRGIFLVFVIFEGIDTTLTDYKDLCPSGLCFESNDCTRRGGRISNNSCNGTDMNSVCCDFSESVQDSCNAIKTGVQVTHFKSPGYPELYGGSLVCQFQLNLDKNTVGVRLDFIDLNLPGNNYDPRSTGNVSSKETEQLPNFGCDSDWFFIKGFPDWMPDPRCGQLTGYSTIIEIDKRRHQRHVTIVFIMSSLRYKWDIKLTQISLNKIRKTDFCLVSRMETWNKELVLAQFYPQGSMQTNNSNRNLGDVSATMSKSGPSFSANATESQRTDTIPGIVSLFFATESISKGIKLCQGMIIDDRHVLTSSSCFLSKNGIPRYSLQYIKILTGNGTFYEPESIAFHANFGSFPFIHDDLSVIRTRTNIRFNQAVRPIGIPREDWALSNSTDNKDLQKIDAETKPVHFKAGCSIKTQDDSKSDKTSVLNGTQCSDFRRKDFVFMNINVTKMELIGKYEGLLTNWLCLKYYERPEVIIGSGCTLVQLDRDGKNPILIGMYSHSSNLKASIHEGKRPDNSGNFIATGYYTKIEAFWKWILMAIS